MLTLKSTASNFFAPNNGICEWKWALLHSPAFLCAFCWTWTENGNPPTISLCPWPTEDPEKCQVLTRFDFVFNKIAQCRGKSSALRARKESYLRPRSHFSLNFFQCLSASVSFYVEQGVCTTPANPECLLGARDGLASKQSPEEVC